MVLPRPRPQAGHYNPISFQLTAPFTTQAAGLRLLVVNPVLEWAFELKSRVV